MKTKALLTATMTGIFASLCSSLYAGKESHGGDLVLCAKSSENSYEGLYSLDYLVGSLQLSQSYPLDEAKIQHDVLERITQSLERIFPLNTAMGLTNQPILESWRQYQDLLTNNADFTKARIWLPSSYGLVDISDEALITILPPNCLKDAKNQSPHAIQAVIRQKPGEAIVYNYSDQLLKTLKERPLQYSFLLVHEWLWDYVQDIRLLRIVNWLIHASIHESADINKIRGQLIGTGFGTSKISASAEQVFGGKLLQAIMANDVQAFQSLLDGGGTLKKLVVIENAENPKVVPASVSGYLGNALLEDDKIPNDLEKLLVERISPPDLASGADLKTQMRYYGHKCTMKHKYNHLFNLLSIAAMLGRKEIIQSAFSRSSDANPLFSSEDLDYLLWDLLTMGEIETFNALAPEFRRLKSQNPNFNLDIEFYRLENEMKPDWFQFVQREELNSMIAAYGDDLPFLFRSHVALLNQDLDELNRLLREPKTFSRIQALYLSIPKEGMKLSVDRQGRQSYLIPSDPGSNQKVDIFQWAMVTVGPDFAREVVKIAERNSPSRDRDSWKSSARTADYFKVRKSTENKITASESFSVRTPLQLAERIRDELPKDQRASWDALIVELKSLYR